MSFAQYGAERGKTFGAIRIEQCVIRSVIDFRTGDRCKTVPAAGIEKERVSVEIVAV